MMKCDCDTWNVASYCKHDVILVFVIEPSGWCLQINFWWFILKYLCIYRTFDFIDSPKITPNDVLSNLHKRNLWMSLISVLELTIHSWMCN